MSLLDLIKAEVDPYGWNVENDFDVKLAKAHPLSDNRRSKKKDDILRISWSLLKSGLTCPRAATMLTCPDKFGVPEEALRFTESLASIRGNLVQSLLEHIYTHNFFNEPPDQFLKALQASWRWGVLYFKPLNTITPAELLLLRQEIFAVLPTIFETLNREGLWAVRQSVEKPLWWDVPTISKVRLTGKADFVFQDPGKYWLADGKYTGNPSYLDAKQLLFYSLILSKMIGKVPERAFFWLYPQGSILDHTASLTPQNLHSILDNVSQVTSQIRSLDTTPNPSNYNCKYCSLRNLCDASRCS